MPCGRPPKRPHAGGRPAVYHSEEERRIARRKSKSKWYNQPENHERVKHQMRDRYRQQKEVDEKETNEVSIPEADHAPRVEHELQPFQPAARAQALFKQFSHYIGPSNDKFVANAIELVKQDYRPGESSPALERIEGRIAECEEKLHVLQNEILNTSGAWSAEYLDVQGILEAVKAISRRISDLHVAHLEGTLFP